jgi:hypothetical protein
MASNKVREDKYQVVIAPKINLLDYEQFAPILRIH